MMNWIAPTEMSAEDRKHVSAAVTEAERHTDAEIVTIVAEQSDHYADVPLFWAGGAALLALSLLAAFPQWLDGLFVLFSHVWASGWAGGWVGAVRDRNLLLAAFAIAAVTFFVVWLVLQWRFLRLCLTPRDLKVHRTRQRAVDLFRVAVEGRTRGRTGILIYLSMREHRAEIVADAAIVAKVTPAAWGDMMAVMIEEVRAGRPGHGMAAAVRHAGDLLALHVPRKAENPNELPDRLIEI